LHNDRKIGGSQAINLSLKARKPRSAYDAQSLVLLQEHTGPVCISENEVAMEKPSSKSVLELCLASQSDTLYPRLFPFGTQSDIIDDSYEQPLLHEILGTA